MGARTSGHGAASHRGYLGANDARVSRCVWLNASRARNIFGERATGYRDDASGSSEGQIAVLHSQFEHEQTCAQANKAVHRACLKVSE